GPGPIGQGEPRPDATAVEIPARLGLRGRAGGYIIDMRDPSRVRHQGGSPHQERKGTPSMGVSFGRSRVADLAFQVFSRAIHPDWFAVRRHRRISQEAWEADVRIIEGGHAITFRSGSVRLTEVLSGPETQLPEPGLLFHSAIRRERSASLQPGDL